MRWRASISISFRDRHRFALSKKGLPLGKFQARIYLDTRFKKKKGRAPRFRKKPDHKLDLELTWKTGIGNRNLIAIK